MEQILNGVVLVGDFLQQHGIWFIPLYLVVGQTLTFVYLKNVAHSLEWEYDYMSTLLMPVLWPLILVFYMLLFVYLRLAFAKSVEIEGPGEKKLQTRKADNDS